MVNILTIDVEDYFQVHAFSKVVRFEDWGNFECRVERNTYRLLDLLKSAGRDSESGIGNQTKGTFFVLGWIAERYPGLIRDIHDQGHEIACHGYHHKLIYCQTRGEFRDDVRKAKKILEDIIGEKIVGYRAPMYSITKRSQWAFDILIEEGFKYDSSIFPIRHDFYGMPKAPRLPFSVSRGRNENGEVSKSKYESRMLQLSTSISNREIHNSNELIEIPISTLKYFGQNIPISGGGYFRALPYGIIKYGIKKFNKVEKHPFIFYIHPWEIDNEQPRVEGLSPRARFRHYFNLHKTERKLRALIHDFRFSTIREALNEPAFINIR